MECSALKAVGDKTLAERTLADRQERRPEVTIRRVVNYEDQLAIFSTRRAVPASGGRQSGGPRGFAGMVLDRSALPWREEARVPVIVARET